MSAQPTAQLAHRPPGPTSAATSTSTPSSRRSPPPQINAVAGPSSVRAQPQPQPQRNMHVGVSRHGASPTANGRARQANLLGGFADEGEADRRSSALAQHLVTKVGKKWDRTAFAATGKRIVPQKKPGAQANEDEEAEEPEEDEPDDDGGTAGFEQFPQGSEYMVNRECNSIRQILLVPSLICLALLLDRLSASVSLAPAPIVFPSPTADLSTPSVLVRFLDL